jgi:hypothetical protein
MATLASLREVLAINKRSPATFASSVDHMPLLWFTIENLQERLTMCMKIREDLNTFLGHPRRIVLFPGHKRCQYDYLQFRICDNDESQIVAYFKVLEILPKICENNKIPYISSDPY